LNPLLALLIRIRSRPGFTAVSVRPHEWKLVELAAEMGVVQFEGAAFTLTGAGADAVDAAQLALSSVL
jgi:hypothetical protein